MSAQQGAPASASREKAGDAPRISCVIPCYKSSRTVGAVVEELEGALLSRPDESYEIILVNDGSPDEGATARTIKEIAATHPHVVAVCLARNFGQHSALMAGFSYVRGEVVVCLDDDGQTPADEVYKLIDKVDEGYDMAMASYGGHKQHSLFRNLGSAFNMWCIHHLMGIPKDLEDTSYFACKRFAVDSALTYTNPYPTVDGLLFRAIDTYCNVPVTHRAREVGESGYTIRKLLGLWMTGVTAFSVVPLRFATYVGSGFSLVGFIFAIIVVIRKLVLPDIDDGWSSIMATLLVVGGLLMMMLGMLGEYVGRIYISLNRSPQYVVRDVVRGEDLVPAGSPEPGTADGRATPAATPEGLGGQSADQAPA